MNFKKYPSYRETGIEWIGRIPKNWEISKIKYQTTINPQTLSENTENDYKIKYLDIGNVDGNGNIIEVEEYSFGDAPSRARRIVKNGDTIVSTVRTYLKAITSIRNAPENLICSTGFAVLRPTEGIDAVFLSYLIRSTKYVDEIVRRSTGVSYPAITSSEIGDMECILPDLKTQKIIGDFLDKKTSEIDSLVVDKERFIDLLEEKRQAIITEVVTKGLNRNVEMKETGLKWLSCTPKNWDIVKLKTVVDVHSSNVDKKSKDGEVPVQLCNYVDVYYNDVITSNLNLMRATARPDQIETFSLRQNDVIITKDSESPDDIAVPAWVEKSLKNVVCGYHLSILRPKKLKIEGKYLYYMLLSNGIKDQFELNANGVTRFGLSMHAIKNAIIPLPPLKEQRDIILYLDKTISKINEIKEVTRSQIQKLREYRQTLISEAVTGKIDVSNYPLERKEETHVN
ncbi:MAG TPA: restriction endonuclease subunit S [Bacillota bacterium]|nr:restriction endonuclease subunit S [Bacillota bacterium]